MTSEPLFNIDHDGQGYRNMSLDALAAAGVPDVLVLDQVKDHLKAGVDAKAETLRNLIMTPGSGQVMEYQEVQAQAVAALKAPSTATEAKYPMLAASIGIDIDPSTGEPATDVLGVARSISAAYSLWQQAGSAIRGVRLAGKKAIDEATTAEEAAEAYGAITWPPIAG
ncbi:hypothetical protein [Methylobacterium iners]|uniref:DUF4376 domain-containing protein n=1 Tax=Methylobacterium iners TaxID=418707 RepID=A0ABQ4RRE4_9HYPH|nr:hypothetical protein [Methylobacterium iners]GJD93351.1 hypothetical protein OCOJLMKI_0544 [Methylobacterium iners]